MYQYLRLNAPLKQKVEEYIPTSIEYLKKTKKRKKVEPYVPHTTGAIPNHLIYIPTHTPQPSKCASTDVNCLEFTATVFNTEKIRRLIRKNGFVIVSGVLRTDECKEVIDGVWKCMEKITRGELNRNNPSTWGSITEQRNVRDVYRDNGIAHAEFMWKVRQNPNVLRVFSTLLRCRPKELLASFDGVSVQTPPEEREKENGKQKQQSCQSRTTSGWYCKNSWYHVDSINASTHRLQSWVTARDVNPGDYTLGVFVGSHKSFDDFRQRFNLVTNAAKIYELRTKEEMDYYETRYRQIRISCPAGSLVVWDSRLVHSALEPLRNRKNPNHRTVCFLSYENRHKTSRQILDQRVSLYRNRRATTTHWADSHSTVPEKNFLGNLTNLKTSPPETDMLKSLVGFPESVLSLSKYNNDLKKKYIFGEVGYRRFS